MVLNKSQILCSRLVIFYLYKVDLRLTITLKMSAIKKLGTLAEFY